MPLRVADNHFATGIWDERTKDPRFRRYTCLSCGHRTTTYAGFRAHRKGCDYRLGVPKLSLADILADASELTPVDSGLTAG